MFKEEREVSNFKWSDLGNIELGRPNLGPTTSVPVYRFMQFTFRDAAIKHTDVKTAERIFYDAGYNSGKAIYENLIGQTKDFAELVSKLQKILKDLNIGILNIEKANVEKMDFTLTVGEDLDSSGLPAIEESVCTFDEGFIARILDSFARVSFHVKEVDCWCTGDKVCRFNAKSVQK